VVNPLRKAVVQPLREAAATKTQDFGTPELRIRNRCARILPRARRARRFFSGLAAIWPAASEFVIKLPMFGVPC
jgi:hypothetical protein